MLHKVENKIFRSQGETHRTDLNFYSVGLCVCVCEGVIRNKSIKRWIEGFEINAHNSHLDKTNKPMKSSVEQAHWCNLPSGAWWPKMNRDITMHWTEFNKKNTNEIWIEALKIN